MSELEDRLSSILGNPQMMQQIMNLAQSMNTQEQSAPPSGQAPAQQSQNTPGLPELDPRQLQMITKLAGQGVDQNQRALLQALSPYVSAHRVEKLEKAMRAARLAAFASSLIQSGGLRMLTGR